jgi:hypothetical protein
MSTADGGANGIGRKETAGTSTETRHEAEQGEEGAVTAPTTTEVDQYLEEVAVHLADLPESERAELLEDLRTHLTEVEAEDEGSLADRLGPPAVYAAELRASAGLQRPAPTAAPAPPRPSGLRELRTRLGTTVRRVPGAAPVFAFLADLRPVWWVARGVAFALLPALVDPVPPELIVLLSVPFVVVSVWLGRRARAGRPVLPNGFVVAVNAVLIVLAVAALANQNRGPDQEPGVAETNFDTVTNLWVYDEQGRLVPDARIYDQEGNPVVVYDPYDPNFGYYDKGVRPWGTPDDRNGGNVYPRPAPRSPYDQMEPAPSPPATIPPLPDASASPSPSGTPTPSPTR